MIKLRSLILCLTAIAAAMVANPQIESVGVAGDGEFTRITVASKSPLSSEVFMRESDNGLSIELVSPDYTVMSDAFYGEPTGGVLAYTLDQDRIIFELEQPMMVSRELELPPVGEDGLHRFVLDLTQVSEARFSQAAQRDQKRFVRRTNTVEKVPALLSAPAIVKADAPSVKPSGFSAVMLAAARQRHTVVIDPGHGGRDPGALAYGGGEEAEIVLQTSLLLKQLLEKDPRYDVRLTRESDVYVEHEDRVTKARNWGADLFISIHADAAMKPTVSGASVYTISTRGEARIEGAAKKYGWELPLEDGTSDAVSGILKDLMVRETKSNSSIFAGFLVPELGQAGPLLRNTHRQKNLFVLLAPDVPAVLVEIGFLTNKADSKRLKSKRGRKKSAEAIKRAIDAYFDRQDLLLATN